MALVLVVDDEPDMRILARVALTRAGHDVIDATDGREALARLQRHPRPDVIVLDIRMPGLSGWDVIDRLPADSPPVLVVTADADAADRHPLLLMKPYRPEELTDAVATAIERLASP